MNAPPFAGLLTLIRVLLLSSPWAALQAQTHDPGWQIMTARSLGNCQACHALPGQTPTRSTFGPSLQGVGARHDATALTQWVTDARKLNPNTWMPPFGSTEGLNQSASNQVVLTAEQIAQVVKTLQSWR